MSTQAPLYTPLHQLNTLVAGITQVNPIVFDSVQSAINFSIYESEPLDTKTNLAESAKRLIALYSGEGKSLSFEHCDLSIYDPLWHRLHIISSINRLSRRPRALLLITGLKEAFCKNSRWSPTTKKAYAEAVNFIESLAHRHTSSDTTLHILFL